MGIDPAETMSGTMLAVEHFPWDTADVGQDIEPAAGGYLLDLVGIKPPGLFLLFRHHLA